MGSTRRNKGKFESKRVAVHMQSIIAYPQGTSKKGLKKDELAPA